MKCEKCEREFVPRSSLQRFCSVKCRRVAYHERNRERRNAYRHEYFLKHREKERESARRRYQEKKDAIKIRWIRKDLAGKDRPP